jgi:flagellar hook protein FlgE
MLDSIYIGTTGLTGYSKGLNVISNNVANLNTPGFKGATLQFGDLYYQQQLSNADGAPLQWSQYGTGLQTLGTQINFAAGQVQQTGNPLDVAITGNGYLITKGDDGIQHLTRAGQLTLDNDGMLVSKTTGANIQAIGTDGTLSNASINDLRTSAPVATQTVTLQGNLSSTESTFTVQPVNVIDALGGQHTLSLVFTASTTTTGAWTVTVKDDAGTEVGTGQVSFTNGLPDSSATEFSVTYSPTGVAPLSLTISLGENSTSYASGNTSSLAVASQDGLALGTLTAIAIDEQGYLVATYSNGQTKKGQQIALAKPASDADLEAVGNAEYAVRTGKTLQVGRASSDGFGTFGSGEIEGSNVDLTSEFTNLIVMQRGYQASSKIVSTADEMIQELFDMKAGR